MMVVILLSYLAGASFALAIPESFAVLAAGAGLVLIAYALRRIGRRKVSDVNLDMQHVTEQN